MRYQRRQLPYLTVWKQFARRGYVVGIEPGTCHVEGRVAEKEKGRAVELAPQNAEAWQDLAETHKAMGNAAEADKAFEKFKSLTR